MRLDSSINGEAMKTETMIIKEAKQDIVNCINSHSLNIAVLEMLLNELLTEVHILAEQQYQKEKEEYENACSDKSAESAE